MGTDVIKVYARLKPEKHRDRVSNYRVHRRPKDHTDEDFLVLQAPIKLEEYIDHRPESWNFAFHGIIDEQANQRDVFEDVGRPVIESVLDGYNGTVFAYGQTGSGKTYSITGDGTTSENQGIIPRALRYLFNVIGMHPENVYSVDVAYLEIYNEYGYDLLDRKQVHQQLQAMRLEDLPRVSIQEDEKGRLHLKNLTFHNVKSEDHAMELFSLGDSRRITADTPMNPQSSRSHCIFTIVVSIKQLGASRYKKAKMHLVDLAGSERVYKCAISGTILNEAKHINLSLHYLEQVIVCLSQDNSTHIPYRNCLLTAILRDSLGGNCVTTMLATLSVSSMNLQETISTCRFAQRVALVRNDAKLIMEHDLDSENTLLRLENEKLRKQVEELATQNENLKNMLPLKEDEDSVKKLDYYKNLVEQRDKEISVLINLLKKAKGKKDSVEINEEKNEQSDQAEIIPVRPGSDNTSSNKGEIRSRIKIIPGGLESDDAMLNKSEIRSKVKKKAKESTAERLSKMGKPFRDEQKIELTSGPENDVKVKKEDKNELNSQLSDELSKMENIRDFKVDRIDKKLEASPAKNHVSQLEKEAMTKDKIIKKLEASPAKNHISQLGKEAMTKDNKTIKKLEASPAKNHISQVEKEAITKDNKINKKVEAIPVKSYILNLEEELATKSSNHDLFNNKTPSSKLHPNVMVKNQFPDFLMNDVVIKNSIVDNNQLVKEDLKRSVEYSKTDSNIEKNLPLTGDPEIDEEIVAFYKAKRTGGIY
ncbi:hypothetical protein KPH14_004780 [Odynerus spinipes]|uniref:Kinesin-like protein n=1 Tax=Odynerus spinipes TaxID=1348599 RepID=A0AAD9RMH2_9HYME|nr:hypothetical protein KPH14_004780 [Odynerus spinipes]